MSNIDPAVFAKLKAILQPYAGKLVIVHDLADHFYLDTRFVMKNNKPLFFGAVKVTKRYVSFHLMPVYVSPELLKDMSEGLRKRMQGKSCFNFTSVDDALFSELATLTEKGWEAYSEAGYLAS